MRVTASVEQFEWIQSEISCVFKPAREVKAQQFARRLDSERVSNILMTSITFIWDEIRPNGIRNANPGPFKQELTHGKRLRQSDADIRVQRGVARLRTGVTAP